MAELSKIEWCTHTFNPWIGCTKVSAACDHCYAEAWDARGLQKLPSRWGPHAARTRTKTWGNPIKWNRAATGAAERPRVFVASLADIFDKHKSILPQWRKDLWNLIKQCPHLDFLLLTKRPQNIARYLPADWGRGYPNVWLGATVENQDEFNRRVPHLLNVPCAIRFLSMEPLLGPVDMRAWKHNGHDAIFGLDWAITGGESGPQYRHVDPDCFRMVRDQCEDAGVAFLFKQWEGVNQKAIKAMGRELDGVIHDGYPQSRLEI